MSLFRPFFRLFLNASLVVCLSGSFFSLQAQTKTPERFEKNIKAFDQRDSLEQVRPGSNLFVGSSSITKWTDIASYFPKSYVINRGFGGSTFEDLLYYADRVISPYQPAKIFVYEGDNDIAAGTDIEIVMKRAKALRKKIATAFPEVTVVFISAKPSVARWNLRDKYVAFNTALKKYAGEEKLTAFVDVWTPMLDEKGEVFKNVFLDDNLHMKANGYEIWQKVLEPHVLKNKI